MSSSFPARLAHTRSRLSFAFVLLLVVSGCTTPERVAPSPAAAPVSVTESAATAPPPAPSHLLICSFNIQFLGSSSRRDNTALAELLAPYDLVVVQELTASPSSNPPGSRQRAKAFFDAMASHGFTWTLSESDTGRDATLNNFSTATEWFVTFYKPASVAPAPDLPHGFLSSPLTRNPDFDRVPYAFAFRTPDRHCDFVLISVHLNPDDASRRREEFTAIDRWLTATRAHSSERDLIVLGDTNLQNQAELHADTPQNTISLNDACLPTNVNPNSPKPYDNVFFDPIATTEIDRTFGFKVIDLIEAMRPTWTSPDLYPGDPFQQNVFRYYYSDHDPVVFRITIPNADDD